MKYLKLFENFDQIKINVVFSDIDTSWEDTSWEDTDGSKLTITDINNYLDRKGVEVENMDPKIFQDIIINVKRDQNRIDNANIDFPIIVSKENGEFNKVLDGQHRIVKCIQNTINNIKVRVLDLDTAPEKFKKIFK